MAECISFGYARVSTEDQNLERQLDALEARGIDRSNIFTEKLSGARRDRPALNDLLGRLRRGDSVTVLSIDRLARSTRQLLEISDTLEEKGVDLISIHENIDTSTPTGKMFFQIMSVIAEFQRNSIKEAQAEGIKAAKDAGRHLGRRFTDPSKVEQAFALHDSGKFTVKECCRMAGISEATFYRRRQEARERA